MFERIAGPLAWFWNGLASVVNASYRVLGAPGRLLQDFLNGSWLGHSLHAIVTDVVVGAATAALMLDLLRIVFGVAGLEVAASWVVGLALLAALGALFSGLTDFKDTAPGTERNVAGLHGLLNILGTLVVAVSLLERANGAYDAAFWLLLVGYLVWSIGAFIGGHVVFKYGYAVNRNAFARGKRAKEFTAVLAAGELAEGVPTKAALGATTLVLVRRGDAVWALKDACSHAGAPLSGGRLDGDGIVCPLHASTFRLRDGAVRHGPATSRQVTYEARLNGGQVEVCGPRE